MTRKNCTMIEGIYNVWQTIGHDILQTWECPKGESPTLTGEDVAGVTIDYVETYLPEHLLKEWKVASPDQRDAWLEETFPKRSLYGY